MKNTLTAVQKLALQEAAVDAYGAFYQTHRNEKTRAKLADLGYIQKDFAVRDLKDRAILGDQVRELLTLAAEFAGNDCYIQAARSTHAANMKLQQLNRDAYYITDAGRAVVARANFEELVANNEAPSDTALPAAVLARLRADSDLADSLKACTGATEVTVTDPAPPVAAPAPAPASDLCAICGEAYLDHRPASNSVDAPHCMALVSLPGDRFVNDRPAVPFLAANMSDAQKVSKVASQFPDMFGLRAFPGSTFRIDLRASYISGDVVMLYVYVRGENRGGTKVWEAFSKSTAAELAREITPDPAAPPAPNALCALCGAPYADHYEANLGSMAPYCTAPGSHFSDKFIAEVK